MKNKICNKCWESNIKKDWKMRLKQRYKCCSCWYVFQNSSRTRNNFMIWKDYGEWKQSYKQLSLKYNLSIPSIQKQLDQISVKKKT